MWLFSTIINPLNSIRSIQKPAQFKNPLNSDQFVKSICKDSVEEIGMFSTVLFPVDQSRESREAAEMVANFVKENHSDRLVLLSVIEDSVSEDMEGDRDGQTQANGHPNGHAEVMSSPEAIAELLANAKQLFEAKGIHAEVQERQGKPAFAICDLADEINADLIIMGCRGMSLVGDGASESVTQRVINLSPCPVLVVP